MGLNGTWDRTRFGADKANRWRLFTPAIAILPQIGNNGAQLGRLNCCCAELERRQQAAKSNPDGSPKPLHGRLFGSARPSINRLITIVAAACRRRFTGTRRNPWTRRPA